MLPLDYLPCIHSSRVASVFAQAARILANLIVAGAGVLLRAGAQAYRQALVSAHLQTIPCLCKYQGYACVSVAGANVLVFMNGVIMQGQVTECLVFVAGGSSSLVSGEMRLSLSLDVERCLRGLASELCWWRAQTRRGRA